VEGAEGGPIVCPTCEGDGRVDPDEEGFEPWERSEPYDAEADLYFEQKKDREAGL
jgi:hypothetical protein